MRGIALIVFLLFLGCGSDSSHSTVEGDAFEASFDPPPTSPGGRWSPEEPCLRDEDIVAGQTVGPLPNAPVECFVIQGVVEKFNLIVPPNIEFLELEERGSQPTQHVTFWQIQGGVLHPTSLRVGDVINVGSPQLGTTIMIEILWQPPNQRAFAFIDAFR